MGKRKRSVALEQAAVDQWNAMFPVGSAVYYTEDDGRKTETKTRSEAWMLCSQFGVILIDGRTGCVHLDRIRLRTEPLHTTQSQKERA